MVTKRYLKPTFLLTYLCDSSVSTASTASSVSTASSDSSDRSDSGDGNDSCDSSGSSGTSDSSKTCDLNIYVIVVTVVTVVKVVKVVTVVTKKLLIFLGPAAANRCGVPVSLPASGKCQYSNSLQAGDTEGWVKTYKYL